MNKKIKKWLREQTTDDGDGFILLKVMAIIFILFLLFTFDGRCMLKGGQPVVSYAGIQECHGKEECLQYQSMVCLNNEGEIIPLNFTQTSHSFGR